MPEWIESLTIYFKREEMEKPLSFDGPFERMRQ